MYNLPFDLKVNCASFCTINDLLNLSSTNRDFLPVVNQTILKQYFNLLESLKIQVESDQKPTLEKRIYHILKRTSIPGSNILLVLSKIERLLKFYFEIVPEDEKTKIKHVNAVALVNLMMEPEKQSKILTDHSIPTHLKLDLVVEELKRVDLFEDQIKLNDMIQDDLRYNYRIAYFSLPRSATVWTNYLDLVTYSFKDHPIRAIVNFGLIDSLKNIWKSIKLEYDKLFINEDPLYQLIPLSDFGFIRYEKIIEELKTKYRFFSDFKREDSVNIEEDSYIFRFSLKEIDGYGNPRIVQSIKSETGRMFHFLLKIENIKSFQDLKNKIFINYQSVREI